MQNTIRRSVSNQLFHKLKKPYINYANFNFRLLSSVSLPVQLKENAYAHSVMEKMEKYNGYLFNINTLEISNKELEQGNIFRLELTKNNSEEKSRACIDLRKGIPELSDRELENTCKILIDIEKSMPIEEMNNLWYVLDQECVRRLKNWDNRTCLRIADYFFHLQITRLTTYNSKMIFHLVDSLSTLKPNETVQLLFYINLQRSCDPKFMSALEDKILVCLPKLTTEEIAIAALAFFKTRNSLRRYSLLRDIQQRFINDVSQLPDPAIAAFGKLFRYCRIADTPLLVEILDRSSQFVHKWNVAATVNLGLITLSREIDHESYVRKMAMKMLKNLSEIRLKDFSYILTCVSTFDYKFEFEPNFYSVIIEELRSSKIQDQLMRHPLYLVSCLLSLAYHSIFPEDLIKQALEPMFFRHVEENSKYGEKREYLVLDTTVGIELPNYTGPRLHSSAKYNIWKNDVGRIPLITDKNLSMHEKTLLSIKYQLSDELGGVRFASIVHVLPHFKLPDIVLYFDKKGQPLPSNVVKSSYHCIAADKNIRSICFDIIGKNSFASNTQRRLAHSKMKKRQLETLGYEVVEIPWYEYYAIEKSMRSNYISEKLLNVDYKKARKN